MIHNAIYARVKIKTGFGNKVLNAIPMNGKIGNMANILAMMLVALAAFFPIEAMAGAQNVHTMTQQVATQSSLIPRFIIYLSYAIGVFLIGQSLLKLKTHVENPTNAPLKDALIRMAVGTLFIALPFTMDMAQNTMLGMNLTGAGGTVSGNEAEVVQQTLVGGGSDASGQSLGWMLLNIIRNGISHWPIFIVWISYIIGIVLIVQSGLKLVTHAQNPGQMPISEPIKFFAAGGLMLALPTIINIIINTLGLRIAGANISSRGYSDTDSEGLDGMMINAMRDLYLPLDTVITIFCIIAGIIFAFMGLHRLTKTEREGARGPMGIGTIFLFLVAGVLMSMGSVIGTITETFFSSRGIGNYVQILGFSDSVDMSHAHNVAAAIVQFMMIVGLISFVRGWFILKAAADGGSQQATIMSSVVHIVTGILLINLGPFLMAVQKTLGIGPTIGLSFT